MCVLQGKLAKIVTNVLKQTYFFVQPRYFHTTSIVKKDEEDEADDEHEEDDDQEERERQEKEADKVPAPLKRITCTLVPGDGVGLELSKSVRSIFTAANVPVDFEEVFLSEIQKDKSVKLPQLLDSVARNGVAIKGILSNPFTTGDEKQSLNLRMRRELDLFANVVHIKSLPGITTRHQNVDVIVVRQATEGEYSFLEHESVGGVVECLKIITEYNSRRIAKFAFDVATKLDRKKVTVVHKANIMKLGDGLFLKTCKEVSENYPQIECQNMIVDNCTMQLASNPNQFDVMVMPNLYGDIIINLCTGLVGGAGLVPGASYSEDYVMFEPGTRHTYSTAKDKDIANPTAIILCACNMLKHCNLGFYGKQLEDAVHAVLVSKKVRTKDLGGTGKTTDFTKAVIENLIQ